MRFGLALLLALLFAVPGGARDGALPGYRRIGKLDGEIRFAGSSTVAILFRSWAVGFRKLYPDTEREIATGGSSTSLAKLLAGECDVAGMSRPMTDEENAAFRKKFGHDPTALSVAVDAICVYVQRDNPIKGLTLTELDQMYSLDLNRGEKRIDQWGEVGLTGDWAELPIRLYGFGPKSGAYSWIQKVVLKGGDCRVTMEVEPGSAGTVNAIGAYRNAIGFAARFYQTRRTRVVPIASEPGKPFVEPTRENAISGKYPLSRRLYLYVNQKPGTPLPKLISEFLAYVTSDKGQKLVMRAGSFCIPREWALANLKAIGRQPPKATTE